MKSQLSIKIVTLLIGLTLMIGCNSVKNADNKTQEQNLSQQRKGKGLSVDEIFSQMDSNNDQKLSKDEVKGPLKNDFSKIDTNGDQYISKEELEKAPKPQRGGPGRR